MSLQIIMAYLGTPIGLILGWSLNEFSKKLSERKEDTRLKRNVIFHLLEIYTTLILADYEKFEKALISEFKSAAALEGIGEEELMENKEIKDVIDKLYTHWESTLLKDSYARYNNIRDNFYSVTERLASINPIYSNSLAGLQDILKGIFEKTGEFPYKDISIKLKMNRVQIDIFKVMIINIIYNLAENKKMKKKIDVHLISSENSFKTIINTLINKAME